MSSPLGLTIFNMKYRDATGNPVDSTDPNYNGQYNSLFNGTKFYYRPSFTTVSIEDTIDNFNRGLKNSSSKGRSSGKHSGNNKSTDIYDISTNSIIDYTNDENLPALKLNEADFAYLRDLGVYPNNRLVIGRRFPSPVENDLTAVSMSPLSTVVSWVPDNQNDFFNFTATESWNRENTDDDPLGKLTDVFNKIFEQAIGRDVAKEGKGVLGGIARKFPLGGVSEALETTMTNYLLGSDTSNGTNFNYDNIVKGNPNFMSESAYRKVNSLQSTISIPIKIVYEMSYIPGVDPTIAFMDLLQNVLRFSSSDSVFYLTQTGGSRVNDFFDNYKKGKWVDAVKIILGGIKNALSRIKDDVVRIVDDIAEVGTAIFNTVTQNGEGDDNGTNLLVSKIESGLSVIASSGLARYRIEFAQIIPSITGASSAPWHVTLGNPKNPFFSSGDMIAEECKVTMGNTLGFNDLPTRIEFECKLKNARNLGIQEIFDKFNVGAGRQYQSKSAEFVPDFYQGSVNKQPTKNSGI